jgi:hypothetical protein
LTTKLSERRKNKKFGPYSKRLSILAQNKEKTKNGTHQIQEKRKETDDFGDIFQELKQLEDDSNIYKDITPKVISGEESPEINTQREEYLSKKNEFLGKFSVIVVEQHKIKKTSEIVEVRKPYDDEIQSIKGQPKNPMTKNMIKNAKKERDSAVGKLKEKLREEREEFIKSLMLEYNQTEE